MTFKIQILTFAVLFGIWSTVYYKLMFSIYCLNSYEYFDHFVRVIQNQKSHHQRPLLRNIVFNLFRCMANEIFRHYVIQQPLTNETYLIRVLYTVIVTILVQIWFPKPSIEKNANWWSFMFATYTISFGICWLNDLT